ncbi:MAG: presenilin family intramembrane aspartyl protease [Candidatus Woesearchaeota archaeon]|nr:presenilin family intramembrane aspartyl protease [Candidatus Woesearchaeota archaeon]
MKHTIKVTFIIIALFLISQLVGLVTVNKHIIVFKDVETGNITITHPDTVLGPPAQVEHKSTSFFFIFIFIIIGTALLLLIIKFRVYKVWKFWFLIAVWATMAVALGVYINTFAAAAVALGLALWKIYKPNVYIYNLTEIFIYAGVTILLLPIINLFAAFGLLVFVSLYDMYAVWRSRHMIKMAKFQTKTKVFAGLLIPYAAPKPEAEKAIEKIQKLEKEKTKLKKKRKFAVLGGGDIAFPMLFSAAVMEHLIIAQHFAKEYALALSALVSLFSAIALLILLIKAKEDKFYPAMPFLSIGCFLGYLIVYLIAFLLY